LRSGALTLERAPAEARLEFAQTRLGSARPKLGLPLWQLQAVSPFDPSGVSSVVRRDGPRHHHPSKSDAGECLDGQEGRGAHEAGGGCGRAERPEAASWRARLGDAHQTPSRFRRPRSAAHPAVRWRGHGAAAEGP